jgi:hypothetical protein
MRRLAIGPREMPGTATTNAKGVGATNTDPSHDFSDQQRQRGPARPLQPPREGDVLVCLI